MEGKTLVIGGAGLLGKAIVKNEQFEYTYFKSKSLSKKAHYLDLGDVENIKKLLYKLMPKNIILTAAITDVDLCEENPSNAYNINTVPLYIITDYVKKTSGFLIFVSTDYVFDGKKGNYREEDEKNPVNIYGKSKSLAENIIFSSGVDYAIIRTSVIFGKEESHGKKNFILWIYENLKQGKVLNILKDQIVSPTLNIYLANAIKEILYKKITGILHIAGKDPLTRYEIALKIKEMFNLDGTIMPISLSAINWKATRPKNSSLSVKKAEKLLTNKPINFEDSLKMVF